MGGVQMQKMSFQESYASEWSCLEQQVPIHMRSLISANVQHFLSIILSRRSSLLRRLRPLVSMQLIFEVDPLLQLLNQFPDFGLHTTQYSCIIQR